MFPERSKTPASLEERVQSQANTIFNFDSVRIEMADGSGWSCRYEPRQGFTLAVDPQQLADETGEVKDVDVEIAGRHELQHLGDMLNKDWDMSLITDGSNTDRLFWQFNFDVTMDGRTARGYDAYKQAMPELYKRLLETDKDQTDQPKHIQFIKAMRSQMVLGEDSEIKISKEVQRELDRLRNYNGYDIAEALIHRGTSLKQRIEISRKIIKPIYDKLVAESDDDNSDDSDMEQQAQELLEKSDMTGAQQPSDGSESLDDQMQQAIEQYNEDSDQQENYADNQDQGDEADDNDSDEEGNGQSEKEGRFAKLSQKIAQMIKKSDDIFTKTKNEDSKDGDEYSDNKQTERDTQREESESNELAGRIFKEMNLSKPDALEYARAVIKNKQLIYEVAEIFKYLANVNEVQSRIKPTRQSVINGASLHTGKLPQAYIQGISDIPMDIWHKKKRQANRQELTFDGLDVWVLTDASGSMSGDPAEYAADLEVVLAEGLLLARNQQEQEQMGVIPDVRLGGLIFGSSTETVMPLSMEPSSVDRAKMFINTRKAGQYSTLVVPSLSQVFESAKKHPGRDVICIVISDNEFGDNPVLIKSNKPANCKIINFMIGSSYGASQINMDEHLEVVNNTQDLPSMLARSLDEYRKIYD